jgi:hypothetical protein
MLKDDEIQGVGNSYTAEFWQYDARLGRRWNVDLVVKPWESTYASFANNPVWFIDPSGADTTFAVGDGTYDKQAEKDFLEALNIVRNKVKELEESLNELNKTDRNNLSKRDTKKLDSKINNTRNNLENWKKLETDFDNIINSDVCFVYSSDVSEFKKKQNGSTIPLDCDLKNVYSVKINVRPGYLSTYIHENRHGNQILNKTSGFKRNSDLFDEIDCFNFQKIFDSDGVYNEILRCRDEEFAGKTIEEKQSSYKYYNYNLIDAVKHLYPEYANDDPKINKKER